jgi:hypothetical protein
MRDFSGDLGVIGFVVYGLGEFSRNFSVKFAATAWIPGETFDFVRGLVEPGFNGSGGGARSGSELSHLCFNNLRVSFLGAMLCTRDVEHTWGRFDACGGPAPDRGRPLDYAKT